MKKNVKFDSEFSGDTITYILNSHMGAIYNSINNNQVEIRVYVSKLIKISGQPDIHIDAWGAMKLIEKYAKEVLALEWNIIDKGVIKYDNTQLRYETRFKVKASTLDAKLYGALLK
jgi:hypothetical protein